MNVIYIDIHSSTATNTVLYQILDGQATSITAIQQVIKFSGMYRHF